MNAVKVRPGIFSCAVDSFLELWMHVLCRFVDCVEGNSILRDLLAVKLEYDRLVAITMPVEYFHCLRDRLWFLIREKCP